VHHYFGGRNDVYIALLERLGAQREEQLPPPWAAAPGRAWPIPCRAGSTGPKRTARSGSPPSRTAKTSPTPTSGTSSPTSCAAPSRYSRRSRRHRRGHAAAALRARVLDRPQPRRHATLATRRGHPRRHARTARLHSGTRPAHLRRATGATPGAHRLPEIRIVGFHASQRRRCEPLTAISHDRLRLEASAMHRCASTAPCASVQRPSVLLERISR
jgi:hypothetical protein